MENKYNFYIKTFFQIFFLLFYTAVAIAQQKPAADFGVDNKVGCGILVAQFTDKSTNNPISWSWKFYQNNSQDTLSSNLQNPVFAFNDI